MERQTARRPERLPGRLAPQVEDAEVGHDGQLALADCERPGRAQDAHVSRVERRGLRAEGLRAGRAAHPEDVPGECVGGRAPVAVRPNLELVGFGEDDGEALGLGIVWTMASAPWIDRRRHSKPVRSEGVAGASWPQDERIRPKGSNKRPADRRNV